MSRHRRSKAKTVSPSLKTSSNSAISPLPRPRSHVAMIAAGSLWLGWLAGLVALAALSANPVTLNRKQIDLSTLILAGRVSDSVQGTVTVSRTIVGEFLEDQITVDNLGDLPEFQKGQSYIFPLRKMDGKFSIVEVSGQQARPVIYPETPEVQKQLKNILQEIGERPFPPVVK